MMEEFHVYVTVSTTQTLICISEFVLIFQCSWELLHGCTPTRYTKKSYLRLENLHVFMFCMCLQNANLLSMPIVSIQNYLYVWLCFHCFIVCLLTSLLIKGLQSTTFVHNSVVFLYNLLRHNWCHNPFVWRSNREQVMLLRGEWLTVTKFIYSSTVKYQFRVTFTLLESSLFSLLLLPIIIAIIFN